MLKFSFVSADLMPDMTSSPALFQHSDLPPKKVTLPSTETRIGDRGGTCTIQD